MFKVAIDAGHGGSNSTPGKRTPDGEYEWDFNNEVVKAFIDEMNQYNVEIRRMDDSSGKQDIPLSTRTNNANQWGADVYVSIHHNANTGKWGDWTGTETYYYEGSDNSERLARLIQKATVEAYGLRNRGIRKGNHLWICRKTSMPSVLVEGGFMDSKIDIKKMRDNSVLRQAGENIARAVAEYFGIIKEYKPKKKAKEPYKTTHKKADLVVDGKWGNSTTKALQKALGTPQDGILSHQYRNSVTSALYGNTVHFSDTGRGSVVIRELQKKIKSSPDGLLGPNTVRQLQKYLGTVQDGKLSRPSLVVKELQRRLNRGDF